MGKQQLQRKPKLLPPLLCVIQNKASRGRPRSGGECGGVAGVRGTAPEPEWGPRGEKRTMENVGSECNFDKQLAIICRGFLSLSRVSIRRFGSWSAKSQLLIGIFLRIKIPISRPIFEGPSARNPDIKQAISPTPEFAEFGRAGRRRDFPFRPYLHARIPRITVVDTTPSN